MSRNLQTFFVVAILLAAVAAAAAMPASRAWLQTLVRWQPTDEPAVSALTQADSGAAAIANQKGNAALLAGDAGTAINDFLQGEAADPRFVWNYVALGGAYAQLNRLADADAQLRQAISIAPTTQFLHYNLATVELREARYAEALRDFNIETRISPQYQPAFTGRHQALAAMHVFQRRHVAVAMPKPAAPILTPVPVAQKPAAAAPPAVAAKPAGLRPRIATRAVPLISATHSHGVTRRIAASSEATAGETAAAPQSEATPDAAAPAQNGPLLVSTGTAEEARSYLLDISQDLTFTQAIPSSDPNLPTAELRQKLQALAGSSRAPVIELLRVGSSALLSGRLLLATTAFSVAANRARSDWRGPYLAGLTAFAGGDDKSAREFFEAANARVPRPETYTSLAIVELAVGDDEAAGSNAERAAMLDPTYGPGRFTAGMVALVNKDATGAWHHLSAASSLSGVPAQLDHFLSLVTPRQ